MEGEKSSFLNKFFIQQRIIALIIILIIVNSNNVTAQRLSSIDINEISDNTNNNLLFDLKIESLMRLGSYPSLSIYTIENNSVLWSKFYGYKDIYHKIQPDKNTIHIIGSISKTITSVALLQLCEKGLFDLDDDINEYLSFSLRNPKFPDDPITFRMLLSHRSSIFDYHLYSKQGKIEFLNCFLIINNIYDIINEFLIPGGCWYHQECWRDVSPGESALYSSFGMLVAAYLVEQISGLSIEEYCLMNIFDPLEMNNTFFHPCINNTNNIAIPYIRLCRVYVPLPRYDTKCLCPIGGIHSSIDDLSHFLIALMNNGQYKETRILNESTINEMLNTIYPEEEYPIFFPHSYGLGIWSSEKFGEKLFGHGGAAPGYLCGMYMNITSKRGFIIFSNHCNPGSPSNPISTLRLYPKTHIIRIKIGQMIMEELNK